MNLIRALTMALFLIPLTVTLGAQSGTLAGKSGKRDLSVGGGQVVWGSGNQILFSSQRKHTKPLSLWTYDLATNKATQTTDNGWEGSGDWVPGFGGLFFSSYGKAKNAYEFQLWYQKTGGKPQLWHKDEESIQYPLVSPDGRWVVASTKGLILVPADKPGKARALTKDGTEYDVAQEWSDDGQSILFIRTTGYYDESEVQIAEVDVATGKVEVLYAMTRQDGAPHSAHYGPDGLLYFSQFDKIMVLDGDEPREVLRDSRDAWGIDGFAFSPDGTALVYERHNQGEDSVLVLTSWPRR